MSSSMTSMKSIVTMVFGLLVDYLMTLQPREGSISVAGTTKKGVDISPGSKTR
ncbi:hypothetical protein LINPERPRIM_LOCUS8722 [Linum perenne]